MKITANDLKELGVIEQVIEEPEPASIDNILDISEQMKEMILGFIEKYDKMTPEDWWNRDIRDFEILICSGCMYESERR